MASLTPFPKVQFFDNNGNPLSGGKLYSYESGTVTPLATYTDSSGGTPNANPVILDSRGEASVWLGGSLYTLVLKTSADVQIWSVDGISGPLTGASIHTATSKTTPVDADEIPITDSAALYALKKLTWANLKATLRATANTWTATQTFNDIVAKIKGTSTGVTTLATANTTATNYTITFPAADITVASAGANTDITSLNAPALGAATATTQTAGDNTTKVATTAFVTTAVGARVSSLSEVLVNAANGYGSTNNKIRRFTTAVVNTGTDITYADSATNGGSFTINTAGIYAISYTDQFSAADNMGISLNSAQLTTGIQNITAANILSVTTTVAANNAANCSVTLKLAATDVVRAHTNGTASGTATAACNFTIVRIA